ncbi:MAG: glycosyltransferase [Planctomycetota bacterium]
MISYIIPTRDRHLELAQTIDRIRALGDHAEVEGAEIIVADNASKAPVRPDEHGVVPARVIRLEANRGAAARNAAAEQADPRSDWLVMLDDDSHPLDTGFLAALTRAPEAAAVIAADITLPDGSRERGGLPEVPVGCGMAVRARVFRELGGYDAAFGYYVEESDLMARLIAGGWVSVFEPAFRVMHRKVASNRDFAAILFRLVRNNGWLLRRYAPEHVYESSLAAMLARYGAIAVRERVEDAFDQANRTLAASIDRQERTPLDDPFWDRFTGHAAALEALAPFGGLSAAIIEPGKHVEEIERAIHAADLNAVSEPVRADLLIIGTLSPGPMLDAMARLGGDARIVAPWRAADRFRPAAGRTRPPRRAG